MKLFEIYKSDEFYKKLLSKNLNIDNAELKEEILEELYKIFIHVK